MFDTCAEHNLGPSISIFEPGFLRVALAEHEAGTLPPGSLVKFYFGGERTLSGLPPTPAGLEAYLDMLSGTGLPWSVAGAERRRGGVRHGGDGDRAGRPRNASDWRTTPVRASPRTWSCWRPYWKS